MALISEVLEHHFCHILWVKHDQAQPRFKARGTGAHLLLRDKQVHTVKEHEA